jgi:hypothetical protein
MGHGLALRVAARLGIALRQLLAQRGAGRARDISWPCMCAIVLCDSSFSLRVVRSEIVISPTCPSHSTSLQLAARFAASSETLSAPWNFSCALSPSSTTAPVRCPRGCARGGRDAHRAVLGACPPKQGRESSTGSPCREWPARDKKPLDDAVHERVFALAQPRGCSRCAPPTRARSPARPARPVPLRGQAGRRGQGRH